MYLQDLMQAIDITTADKVELSGLCMDSRHACPGVCFLAFPGMTSDGRDYIDSAVRAGAVAVLYESNQAAPISINVPAIAVENLAEKIGLLASYFYGHPSESLRIVGITGTNGKTSASHALAQAYKLLGKNAAVMGTLGVGLISDLKKTGMTTPDALCVQEQLAHMRDTSVDYVAMEVSSHALAQYRVAGVKIQTAVYTQLSPDHLDFHGTMEEYARCKEKLLQMPGLQRAIINADDKYGACWIEKYHKDLPVIAYRMGGSQGSLTIVPTLCCDSFSVLPNGSGYLLQLSSPWGEGECELNLLGEYNIKNALAVIATLAAQSFPWESILKIMPRVKAVPGRMQWFKHPSGASVVVDFAHTPDALEQVLKTLQPLCKGELHCVFGCGGDRDASKRAVMGAIAASLADQIWITNDNPRSENPAKIAEAIRAGCGDHSHVEIILDRVKAIESALTATGEHDMILVAGKGHEAEQIIGDRVIKLSDIECVRSLCR